MRTYLIYLIEDEIADYFYGRENKLYDLFAANRKNAGEMEPIIEKQINYITRSLPYLDLHRQLSQSVRKKILHVRGKVYCSSQSGEKEGAELFIGDRSLKLKAWGGYESEAIFFEVLRRFEGRFLAIDIEHKRFGWIRPKKERKFV